jgi:hypothetical protein
MDFASFAFPKPSDIEREPETVRVFSDGREICNKLTVTGRREYRWRVEAMRLRQKGRCCLEGYIPECPGALLASEATFEHENGRGGGRQDDRIEVNGRWQNGAAHALCNHIKGSRKWKYNHTHNWEDVRLDPEPKSIVSRIRRLRAVAYGDERARIEAETPRESR